MNYKANICLDGKISTIHPTLHGVIYSCDVLLYVIWRMDVLSGSTLSLCLRLRISPDLYTYPVPHTNIDTSNTTTVEIFKNTTILLALTNRSNTSKVSCWKIRYHTTLLPFFLIWGTCQLYLFLYYDIYYMYLDTSLSTSHSWHARETRSTWTPIEASHQTQSSNQFFSLRHRQSEAYSVKI